MKNPLVSIVICCHNRAHLLPQTMESVFAQKYEPVEIVVVDDGSTDDTPELMASYGERIRYCWQENQGIAQTRTNGCELAKGEYIAFQDDDDLMPPERITVLYKALKQHPSAVLAVGDWAVIDEDGNTTGHRWLPESSTKLKEPILFHDGYRAILWPEVPAVLHTTLFRKSDGGKIGWFDTRFVKASEDKDFLARLGQLGPIVYVPKVVSYYRRGHTSLTSKRLDVPYSQYLLFEKHLTFLNHRRSDLKKRLQYRLLLALTQIAMHKDTKSMQSDFFSRDYLKKGLSLLGYKNSLKYHWSALIKYPMRKLVRKFSRN